MRKAAFGLLLLCFVLVCPLSLAAPAQLETVDFLAKDYNLSISKYDERASLVFPERPLSFEAEIPYQASVDDRRSSDRPAYLRLTIVAPGGGVFEEIILRPGDKKNGVIRLLPGYQVRLDAYCGQYTFLFVKNGADIRAKLHWPEFRFAAREQFRYYAYTFSAAGWAEVDRMTWDFGDGTKAEGAQVEHVYRKPGTYKLQVFGYRGRTPVQNYQRNMVVPDFIEVKPEVGPLEGAAEFVVQCRSGLTTHYGEQAECVWDFGDGTPPVIADDAEHTYRQAGRYTLTMTARSLSSSYNVRKTWTVTVRPLSVQAKALITPLEGPVPLKIECLAQPRVDGQPVDLAYRWDFGDGNFAERTKATHYYGAVGQYQVTLTIADRLHPELYIQPVTYVVRALPPVLNVSPTANPTQGNAPLTVAFESGLTVRGYPADPQYRWDFGDGTTAKEANPVHTFQSYGEYEVQLTVTDAIHRTEVRGRVHVSVRQGSGSVPSGISASINAEPRSGRAPLSVVFRGQATAADPNAVLSYDWEFGDGQRGYGQTISHIYQRPGSYRAILTVRDTRAGRTDYGRAELVVTVS